MNDDKCLNEWCDNPAEPNWMELCDECIEERAFQAAEDMRAEAELAY